MKLTTNFQLQEFVNPEIWERFRERSIDWIHPQLAKTAQAIRDACTVYLGYEESVTINDWLWNDSPYAYKDSGLRLPITGEFAIYSGHKGGYAIDLKFKHLKTDDVFDLIMNNKEQFPHICRIEDIEATRTKQGKLGRDWLHIEVSHLLLPIKVFKP